MSGTCKILIFEAHLDKDVNSVFDMVPNYKIEYNGKTIVGERSYMNKDPTWNDHDKIDHTLDFGPNPTGNLKITFESEGTYICDCSVAASDLAKSKNAIKWYDSSRKGAKSGNFKMQAIYRAPHHEEAKMPEGKKRVTNDPSVTVGLPVQPPM